MSTPPRGLRFLRADVAIQTLLYLFAFLSAFLFVLKIQVGGFLFIMGIVLIALWHFVSWGVHFFFLRRRTRARSLYLWLVIGYMALYWLLGTLIPRMNDVIILPYFGAGVLLGFYYHITSRRELKAELEELHNG